ncbi:MAG: hypothetical protein WCL04_07445, partial [Verrucomicrobiota bacterium]
MHTTTTKCLFALAAVGFATLLSPTLPAAAGRAGGAPAPLTIDNLKTALTLTDAQVAQITPFLDSINQGQQALTAAQTGNTDT